MRSDYYVVQTEDGGKAVKWWVEDAFAHFDNLLPLTDDEFMGHPVKDLPVGTVLSPEGEILEREEA